MLYDNHGRVINYLRLAVTDRCNLRCFYCMPEQGIEYIDRTELMTYEEMERIIDILYPMGINKIRITGGEPFLRKDLLSFLERILNKRNLNIHITSNGTLLRGKLIALKNLGITDINLSLDTLDRDRFKLITRRDELNEVLRCLEEMITMDFNVKINMVVMKSLNEQDLIPMAELTKSLPITVRFLEEMPFNGKGSKPNAPIINHLDIYNALNTHYNHLNPMEVPAHSTSQLYKIQNYKGKIGIIASYSRTFCGTCNRIRLTPQGQIKTCLYDDGVFNLKDLMRNGATNLQLKTALLSALNNRSINGHEAEQKRNYKLPISESMATIGG